MAYRLLIVDDEPLIAFEIEDTMLRAGYEIAGVTGSVAAALAVLDTVTGLDGVILDANLKNESSQPVYDRVRALGIPCIVISGYSREQIGDWIRDTPFMKKPFLYPELIALTNSVLRAVTPS